jgi:hypothetical protein
MTTHRTRIAGAIVMLGIAGMSVSACGGDDGVVTTVQAAPMEALPAPEGAGALTEPGTSRPRSVIPDDWMTTIPEVEQLVAELGSDRTGGAYVNEAQEYLVVTVTDAEAERRVLEAGFHADRVVYSTDELNAITEALNESIQVANTGWGTDVIRNQIIVRISASVSDTDVAAIESVIEPFGGAAAIERAEGDIRFSIGYDPEVSATAAGPDRS